MDLSDERWSGLQGGYRVPYDPRAALQQLERGNSAGAWEELWGELHHQGDVGIASYAAVPELVRIYRTGVHPDWNTYALAATIEGARRAPDNPPVPDWLASEYQAAWQELESLALRDFRKAAEDEFTRSILAVLALRKGQVALSRMAMLTEDERQQMLDECGWG